MCEIIEATVAHSMTKKSVADCLQIFMKTIEKQLMAHKEQDELTNGYPVGQADCCDERKLVSLKLNLCLRP
jgi:hypothetical protein